GSSSAGALFVMTPAAQVRTAPEGDAWPATLTELEREHVLLDLGQPRTVRSIGFALRWHYPELAERLAIEISVDGTTWTTAWEQWTGGPALAGALENALENPVRITLPDVTARYVRIHPAPRWLARELRVYGPR
ncbi:MAG TPA: discoidin domain-containing protein, partial [Vicinamibacterales bacterium]